MVITITQDDDVGGDIRIFCTPASGERFPIDTTTTVTCTARDAAGNEGTASFTITVQDTTPTPTVFCYTVEFTSGVIRTHCFSTEEECGAGEGINRAQAGVARIVSSCEGFETHPAGAESCFIAPGDPEFGIPPQVACSA